MDPFHAGPELAQKAVRRGNVNPEMYLAIIQYNRCYQLDWAVYRFIFCSVSRQAARFVFTGQISQHLALRFSLES